MKTILEQKIRAGLEDLQKAGALLPFELPEILVERPKEEQFGEYSSNVALMLAKQAKMSPMELAQVIESGIKNYESPTPPQSSPRAGEEVGFLEKIEVVKPGYINFYLTQKKLAQVVSKVLAEQDDYGKSDMGKGVRVNNEFISANPTGPLHLGNARGGFYGDTLSKVLRKAGYDVVNEYFVNDGGQQIIKLAHSVLKDSEAVYEGEYIEKLNQQLTTNNLQREAKEIGEWAAKEILENVIKKTLREKMNVTFDIFTSEQKDIVENGYVEKAIQLLTAKGYTYEAEGALWFKTTEFGDDKDRVLRKSDGNYAYIAPDCGYFFQRIERGFQLIIMILGADHHGFVSRLRAAAKALGFAGELAVPLVQLVKVVKDGEEVRMSKRAGNVITIDELIDTVGHDVARFFFLMYAPETQMNFDLGLAEERSQKNPVFYVQYAHARLSSILRKAEEEGFDGERADLSLLVHAKERELIRELLFFPELIESIAHDFTVHRLPQYAIRLADKLHSFYADCRVLDEENKPLTSARLDLIKAVRIVLAETLNLMGIAAPEKM